MAARMPECYIPFMFATSPFWLHLAAIASLFPIGILSWRGRPGTGLFWLLALAACTAMAGWLGTRMGQGWALDFAASLDVIVAVTLILFVALSTVSSGVAALAPLVLAYCIPLGIVAVLSDAATQTQAVEAARQDVWFWVHIGIAVSAFAFATLAALAGIAVLFRERMLKRKKQSDFVGRLPAMVDAETLQFRLLQGCAVLLGAVLATGMATAYTQGGSLLDVDHKSLLTLIAFVLVIFLLAAHRWLGWRGRKAVQIVLAVQLLLALGYPGVKFVTDILSA